MKLLDFLNILNFEICLFQASSWWLVSPVKEAKVLELLL
jgi:hypothetical protein